MNIKILRYLIGSFTGDSNVHFYVLPLPLNRRRRAARNRYGRPEEIKANSDR